MSIRLWTAAAVAAMSLAGAATALAADLGDSPYNDPRYGETYREPAPVPQYSQPYPDAYRPPYGGYRDERPRQGYLAPMPGPPAYGRGYPDQGYPRYAERCVPRELIREQLRRQGWRSFEDIDAEDRFVFVRAQDWSGNVFDLRLDRCSGRVLQTRLVEREPADYAWRTRRGYPSY
jgi:hypothetical protein